MEHKIVKINTKDYQDWADAINPTDNEAIYASKCDRDDKIAIVVSVKDFKEYLAKVKANIANTKSWYQLRFGNEW